MGKTIVVANQKGGVGKTTIAFNVAKQLAKKYRVLAIDNDPQGDLTNSLIENPEDSLRANILDFYQEDNKNISPQNISKNLDYIGASIDLAEAEDSSFEVIYRFKESLSRFITVYDFVIIDNLPSFGKLNMASLNAADYVLIPTKPAPFALRGLTGLVTTIERVRKRLNPNLKILGIVLNLIEGRNTVMGKDLEKSIRKVYGDLVFKNKINKGIKLEESPGFQQAIFEYDPKSKPAIQMKALVKELLERIGEQ